MTFKIVKNPEFTHDVPINEPGDDGHVTQELRTRFRVVEEEIADEFDLGSRDGLKAFLRLAIVGFEDVEAADGKPADYDEALREELLAVPYVRLGLLRGYMGAVVKASAGN